MENLEREMSKEEGQAAADAARRITSADFSFQFSAAREHQKVEKKVFNILCEISKENKKSKLVYFNPSCLNYYCYSICFKYFPVDA